MADYVPVFLPGEAVTFMASAAVTAGQIMEVSGSGTVAPYVLAASPSIKVVGVAGHDCAANKPVTVYIRGCVHESVAQGTVTAGDQVSVPVTGDTAGAQVKTVTIDVTATPTQATINGAINASRAVLGVALTTVTNPAKVRWMSF